MFVIQVNDFHAAEAWTWHVLIVATPNLPPAAAVDILDSFIISNSRCYTTPVIHYRDYLLSFEPDRVIICMNPLSITLHHSGRSHRGHEQKQQTPDIHPMLGQCWASVVDDGSTMVQQCVVGPMAGQRRRRWTSFGSTSGRWLAFTWETRITYQGN